MIPFIHRSRGAARLALVLTVTGSLASPALATSVRRLSLSDMTGKAVHVVHARAVANEVTLDESDGYYYTVTTFEVVEKAKGPLRPGELLEVEIIGGRPPGGEWATIVAEAPRFQVGEEVVLFATPGRAGHHYLAGFFQGAVRLKPAGGGMVLLSAPPEFLPGGSRLMHKPDDLSTLTVPGCPPGGRARSRAARPDTAVCTRNRSRPRPGRRPRRDASRRPGRLRAGMKVGDFLERVRNINAAQLAPREVGR